MRRVSIVVCLVVAVMLGTCVSVLAEPVSLTAYSAIVGDVTEGLGAVLPGVATAILAVAAGLLLLRVGWGTIKRFLGR